MFKINTTKNPQGAWLFPYEKYKEKPVTSERQREQRRETSSQTYTACTGEVYMDLSWCLQVLPFQCFVLVFQLPFGAFAAEACTLAEVQGCASLLLTGPKGQPERPLRLGMATLAAHCHSYLDAPPAPIIHSARHHPLPS
ncbi:Xk-Related Protein 6 [Manis pentadactyla]|nr:Xk-Related Protein 6 [Manis pentadactyla]